MDSRSGIMNYYLDFHIGSTFLISSPISHISITWPSYQQINDSDLAQCKEDVDYLWIHNSLRITIVNGQFFPAANLISCHWTNNYWLILEWFILKLMRCQQHQSIMASRDMKSHIWAKLITNNWYTWAQLTEWTYMDQCQLQSHLTGVGQMGLEIYISCLAQDSLHSMYGKTAQLQNTLFLAPIKCSQTKGSEVWRNH